MLVKFEQNRMVRTTRNSSFLTKTRSFITIFDKELTLEDVSVPEIIV